MSEQEGLNLSLRPSKAEKKKWQEQADKHFPKPEAEKGNLRKYITYSANRVAEIGPDKVDALSLGIEELPDAKESEQLKKLKAQKRHWERQYKNLNNHRHANISVNGEVSSPSSSNPFGLAKIGWGTYEALTDEPLTPEQLARKIESELNLEGQKFNIPHIQSSDGLLEVEEVVEILLREMINSDNLEVTRKNGKTAYKRT